MTSANFYLLVAKIDEIELRGILKTRTILNFIYFCILCVPCISVSFFL